MSVTTVVFFDQGILSCRNTCIFVLPELTSQMSPNIATNAVMGLIGYYSWLLDII